MQHTNQHREGVFSFIVKDVLLQVTDYPKSEIQDAGEAGEELAGFEISGKGCSWQAICKVRSEGS